MPAATPKVYVVSAPSGAGKHTLLHEVFERNEGLEYSVSATTRPPRPGEVPGRDYCFLSEDAFRARVDAGDFVEWANVHGYHYGTLREELERLIASGSDVILELDVQGMRSVKAVYPDAVTIFIAPPSLEELGRRLRERGTDHPEEIALRLRNAEEEMAARGEYDHVIVNDTVVEAVQELERILRRNRHDASEE